MKLELSVRYKYYKHITLDAYHLRTFKNQHAQSQPKCSPMV